MTDQELLELVAALRCPRCLAMNRPGATIIELETPTRAVCGVCAHAFNPQEQEQRT